MLTVLPLQAQRTVSRITTAKTQQSVTRPSLASVKTSLFELIAALQTSVAFSRMSKPGLTNRAGANRRVGLMTSSQHVYEVRPRKDRRGVGLISDALPFGRLWYVDPDAISNAVGY